MRIRTPMGILLATALAIPAWAAAPMSGRDFVAKAGAGDMWELKEAAMMTTSTNSDVAAFAKQMTTDHTQSTAIVKAAAKADGVAVTPVMSPKQQADLAALSASKGAARDSLYITQQKAAHADALALMQGYAASGKAPHLKAAAAKIAPVVQGHIDMLGKLAL